jgi:hypothetical protein
MTARRTRLALGTIVAGIALVLPAPSGAEVDCSEPTVNTLLRAEAAVSRPALQAPSEYGLSNVYSFVEQATRPLFGYAEAGPQYAGAFEALAPADTPPPPRAVAAHPAEDMPEDATEDWGGVSRASVTPISASASSSGGRELGVGGATAESARSWVTSTIECDVITVIAGWTATDVALAPGVTVAQMGERVTLVVAPSGSSADVEVTLVGAEGVTVPGVAGRPLDPLTDPIREGGGPTIEAGEPRAESGPDGAWASGGGFNVLFLDPETDQGAGYRIGSIEASVEVLGALTRGTPGATVTLPPVVDAPVVAPPAAPAVEPVRSVTGNPPPASETALEIERVAMTEPVFAAITVTTRSWSALAVLVAALAALGTAYAAARTHRQQLPTVDWLLAKSDRRLSRFVAVYLRW